MGNALAVSLQHGGENLRTFTYTDSYLHLLDYLKADNPNFDELRFSYAVAQAENTYLERG